MVATDTLSTFFQGIVFKRLSAVEVNSARSNQHEFNGSKPLIHLFGLEQPQRLETDFYRMTLDGEFLFERGMLTWYDARARHPTRTEYRLYYHDNAVTRQADAGDTLLIGRKVDGGTFVLIAPPTGPAATRIAWLFGIEVEPGAVFAALDLCHAEGSRLRQGLGLHTTGVSNWEAEDDVEMEIEAPQLRSTVRELQRRLSLPDECCETKF